MLSNYQPFGMNRGIGFNRGTWEAGNSLGRAARPYIDRSYKYMKNQLFKRTVKKDLKRKAAYKNNDQQRSVQRGKQIEVGGHESKSFFTLRKKNKSKIGKLELTKDNVVTNLGVRQTSLIGKQNSFIMATYFDATDVASLYTDIGVPGKTTKIVINSVHSESLITNQESSNGRVYIYDVIARRDGQTNYADPNVAFQLGFADASGGAAANYLIPGATPFLSCRFTEWFKILKVTEVLLAPGQIHTHVVNYSPNKLFSHEIDSGVGAGFCIGGLTVYSFVIHHGTPENDSATHTSATVTLSASNLDIVTKKSMSFVYAHEGYASNSMVNNLPLTFTVGGEQMNDSGGIIPETNA